MPPPKKGGHFPSFHSISLLWFQGFRTSRTTSPLSLLLPPSLPLPVWPFFCLAHTVSALALSRFPGHLRFLHSSLFIWHLAPLPLPSPFSRGLGKLQRGWGRPHKSPTPPTSGRLEAPGCLAPSPPRRVVRGGWWAPSFPCRSGSEWAERTGPDWLRPEPICASICRAAEGAGWGLGSGDGVGAGGWVQRWPPGLGVRAISPPNSLPPPLPSSACGTEPNTHPLLLPSQRMLCAQPYSCIQPRILRMRKSNQPTDRGRKHTLPLIFNWEKSRPWPCDVPHFVSLLSLLRFTTTPRSFIFLSGNPRARGCRIDWVGSRF